jgi:DNA-directed RNA polymerase subunit RPC12/RpoP
MTIGWLCESCNFEFGAPMIDTKTNERHCPYCGSKKIIKN